MSSVGPGAGPGPRPTRRPSRGASWALATTGALAAGLGYVGLVPPEIPSLRGRDAESRPRDGAWGDYALAMADLQSEPLPGWLRTVFDRDALAQNEEAYLVRHQAAFALLSAAGPEARTASRAELPTAMTAGLDQRLARSLAQAAGAETRRLRGHGRPKEAVELGLAAYRFGTDVSDPISGTVMVLYGSGCRYTAQAALLELLAERGVDEGTWARLARSVAGDDRRMPGAYETMAGEWGLMQRTFEGTYLRNGASLRAPAGLRSRVFLRFLTQHDRVLAEARPHLEAWDIPALSRLDRDVIPALAAAPMWREITSPLEAAATSLTRGAVAPFEKAVRVLYVDRASGTALQALAAARAFEAVHGRPPESLAAACSGIGVDVPRDPATQKAVGYRLEAGSPVVWLAGFDGRDDGGGVSYGDRFLNESQPGRDLVYRLGELPPFLQTPNTKAQGASPRRVWRPAASVDGGRAPL